MICSKDWLRAEASEWINLVGTSRPSGSGDPTFTLPLCLSARIDDQPQVSATLIRSNCQNRANFREKAALQTGMRGSGHRFIPMRPRIEEIGALSRLGSIKVVAALTDLLARPGVTPLTHAHPSSPFPPSPSPTALTRLTHFPRLDQSASPFFALPFSTAPWISFRLPASQTAGPQTGPRRRRPLRPASPLPSFRPSFSFLSLTFLLFVF